MCHRRPCVIYQFSATCTCTYNTCLHADVWSLYMYLIYILGAEVPPWCLRMIPSTGRVGWSSYVVALKLCMCCSIKVMHVGIHFICTLYSSCMNGILDLKYGMWRCASNVLHLVISLFHAFPPSQCTMEMLTVLYLWYLQSYKSCSVLKTHLITFPIVYRIWRQDGKQGGIRK